MTTQYVTFEYLTDAAAIYQKSFDCVRAAVDMDDFPSHMHPVVIRMVHASANPDIVPHVRYTDDAVSSMVTALQRGTHVLCDSHMVVAGVDTRRLDKEKNPLICTLNDIQTPALAKRYNTTRSAAAVALWRSYIDGAIVIIGNAPTALFYLLERILNDNWAKPACIVALPIGYVGAAESKQALIAHAGDIPYITLSGKMGGSAMACAVFNAILGVCYDGT